MAGQDRVLFTAEVDWRTAFFASASPGPAHLERTPRLGETLVTLVEAQETPPLVLSSRQDHDTARIRVDSRDVESAQTLYRGLLAGHAFSFLRAGLADLIGSLGQA